MVVGFLCGAAHATVEVTQTYLGTASALGGELEVWNITFTSDGDLITGVFFDWPGPVYQLGAPAEPPLFPFPFYTPTVTEAGGLPDPTIDTHFNLEQADFVPAIVPPTETNDFSFGISGSGWTEGLGSLSVQAGVATQAAAPTLDLVNLAVLGSLGGHISRSGFGPLVAIIGEKSGAEYEFYLIPEPAALSLLCLGGLAALLRRRR